MALSVVGNANNGAANNGTAGDWDVSGIAFNAGDIGLFWWWCRDSTKTFTEPAGVTQKHDFAGGAGFGRLFIGYRYLVGGDTTFGWTASSVSTVTVLWGVTVIRGGPSSGDPFETESGTPATFTDTNDPDPPATTPTTNNSIVITVFGANNDHTTITAPTNYTLQNNASSTLGGDASYAVATRILSGGGGSPEDPPIFTRTGGATTDDGAVWTGSIAPGVATTPVSIAATAVGVATITRTASYFRSLSAVAIGVATLNKTMFVTMAVVTTGVATLATALLTSVAIDATSVGIATLTAAAIFPVVISAVAIGVASLATLFIAGSGAVGRIMGGMIASVGRLMNR